jgi:hypothetical protein
VRKEGREKKRLRSREKEKRFRPGERGRAKSLRIEARAIIVVVGLRVMFFES